MSLARVAWNLLKHLLCYQTFMFSLLVVSETECFFLLRALMLQMLLQYPSSSTRGRSSKANRPLLCRVLPQVVPIPLTRAEEASLNKNPSTHPTTHKKKEMSFLFPSSWSLMWHKNAQSRQAFGAESRVCSVWPSPMVGLFSARIFTDEGWNRCIVCFCHHWPTDVSRHPV